MGNRIHVLAQQLTGKQNLDDCSLDEVKQIAQRYPYYAPAQFLLLQKLRQSGLAEEADAQYKKAVLFYPDPLQFEFFISREEFYEEQTETREIETSSLEVVEEEKNENEDGNVQSTLAEVEEPQPPAFYEEENQALAVQPSDLIEDVVVAVDGNEKATDNSRIDIATEEPQESVGGKVPSGNAESTTAVNVLKEDATKAQQTSPALTFEPYHTVDYFASQGIKISQDELPKDKLGKQLKSFTEWLKTMKRLPASQLNQNAESAAEKGVESLANRSVTDSEVVTEAMAEVWAKQGATEKALDIYNKLLLHNPSKKAYFAAKIENLKQS